MIVVAELENVVLVRRGEDEVKITDFGMAKDTIESHEGPKTMNVGTSKITSNQYDRTFSSENDCL